MSPKNQDMEDRNNLKTINATRATWFTIGTTGIYYPLQIYLSLGSFLALGGLHIKQDQWAVGLLDFFLFNFLEGTAINAYAGAGAIAAALALISFLIANLFFMGNFVNPYNRSSSLLAAAGCVALSTTPILAFIPWIWIWCAVVIKNQKDDQVENEV